LNPVRPIDPYLPKVHLNVILPPTPRSSKVRRTASIGHEKFGLKILKGRDYLENPDIDLEDNIRLDLRKIG
jgi:hypothetical protein